MKPLCLFFLSLLVTSSAAQELNCNVIVNVENVPSSQRDYLTNFKSDIEKYLNNNKWSDEDLGGEKIDCEITILFLAASRENRYTARVVVGSQRPVYVGNDKSEKSTQVLRIDDGKWEFGYVPNQQMVKDDFRFDPLMSFLDFYAYLIIGLDLETYNELSGSRLLQKALNVCNQANASSFSKDWQAGVGTFSRFGLIDELMNLKYQQFRLAFYSYHFEGLDLLGTEQQKGLENILNAIESIATLRQKQNPRSLAVKAFFDSKHREIADVFLAWPDRGVYDRLTAADPDNQGTYDDYRRR